MRMGRTIRIAVELEINWLVTCTRRTRMANRTMGGSASPTMAENPFAMSLVPPAASSALAIPRQPARRPTMFQLTDRIACFCVMQPVTMQRRAAVVLVMAWGMVFITSAQKGLGEIQTKSWIFLILSGLATGASWLCYYKALQMGEASKVVPIDKLSVVITMVLAAVILHEQFTVKSIVGCLFIAFGTLLMVL